MPSISVTSASTFVSALETGFQNLVSGFKGFGTNIGQDIVNATVDVEDLAPIIEKAFTASGNVEAAVVSPLINGILSVIAGLEKSIGLGATSTDTTAPANTTQPVIPAVPVAPVPAATAAPAVAKAGDDGLGDNDADTGAL